MALKYLRDNLKSLTWILWGVVGVFVMLIFLLGIGLILFELRKSNDLLRVQPLTSP